MGKLKLRWMGPYIIKEEVVIETFILKNLDGSINASTENVHTLQPYNSPKISGEALLEIFSIWKTLIEVNWTSRKSSDSKDTCKKIKKDINGKKGENGKSKEGHIMFLENHINPITVQIDVMDEKDTSKTTQLANVTKIKENLDMSEDMQRNGKTSN